MTYLNINNHTNEMDNDPENYRYLRRIPKQWNYRGTFEGLKRKQVEFMQENPKGFFSYQSIPLLYQYQRNLKNVWNKFEADSLITNRSCLRQLATLNVPNFVNTCSFRLYKARDLETGAILDQYVLELSNLRENDRCDENKIYYDYGACVSGMLRNDNQFSPKFNTYKHANFKLPMRNFHRTTSCPAEFASEKVFIQPKNCITIYYTCEIDAVIKQGFGSKTKYIPVEIKSRQIRNNSMALKPKKVFEAAIQCQLAGVNDIVYGFHDGKRILDVKKFSLEELKDFVATFNFNVDQAIAELKFILREMINKFDQNVFNGSMEIGDSLKIVKRPEIKERQKYQRFCLDYYPEKQSIYRKLSY